ncbi:sensor histidine kinase [Microvirga solisilvae]|uniref:sensor histidine kinase n=1 Tax=Microvirga solisilvae TaxID=2919498 RepID=UPI001FB033E5|nr:histidine kinase dimerization/phosphoacceptor domain -containing protein [Microvirga solisilvae]
MDRAPALQSSRTLRILLLEDSALDAELVTETLSAAGLRADIERVDLEQDFSQALGSGTWDLVLADYLLPGFDGLNALKLVRERRPELPFVFVSGALGEEVAVEALKRGATDYVIKDKLNRLPATVLRALAEAGERTEKRQAQDALQKLLDERTALLHELDHRVKNNLQLLLSLTGIEIRHAEDEATTRVLERMRERLQALGAAHRDLYDGNGSSRFDVSRFARELCEELAAARPDMAIMPEFDVEDIEVEAAKAAPMALLFNELIVNTLTHAYKERHGKLKLGMRVRDNQLLFQISDDAFSPQEKRAAQEGASGTILKGLARQLDASVEWPSDAPEVLVRVLMPVHEVG